MLAIHRYKHAGDGFFYLSVYVISKKMDFATSTDFIRDKPEKYDFRSEMPARSLVSK